MALPLKVRVGIRDHWDAPTSDVRQALSALKSTIGCDIAADPEWKQLLPELGKTIQGSPDALIPAIASCVAAWARAVDELVDKKENESWTEELLEAVKESAGTLKIVLQVSDSRKTTVWNKTAHAFEICFTRRADSAHKLTMMTTGNFHADLLGAFKSAGAADSGAEHKQGASAAAADPGTAGWVDAGRDDASDIDFASILTPATTSVAPMAVCSAAPVNERLPQVNMIDRPEDFLMRPPYLLTVRSTDRKIIVQGSHQPSLELLADYLKKWAKTNRQFANTPPMAEVNLHASPFGMGTIYDRIEIEPQYLDQLTCVNPTIVMCFIESILGYHATFQNDNCWHYRRDVALKY